MADNILVDDSGNYIELARIFVVFDTDHVFVDDSGAYLLESPVSNQAIAYDADDFTRVVAYSTQAAPEAGFSWVLHVGKMRAEAVAAAHPAVTVRPNKTRLSFAVTAQVTPQAGVLMHVTFANYNIGRTAALAPDGTMTAELLTDDGTNSYHEIFTPYTLPVPGAPLTLSTWAKAGTLRYINVSQGQSVFGTIQSVAITVDLQTGAITESHVVGPYPDDQNGFEVTDEGGGWWRIRNRFQTYATYGGIAIILSNAAIPPYDVNYDIPYVGSGQSLTVWRPGPEQVI
jgi:hypothetical protein